jgi:hypothetical protein
MKKEEKEDVITKLKEDDKQMIRLVKNAYRKYMPHDFCDEDDRDKFLSNRFEKEQIDDKINKLRLRKQKLTLRIKKLSLKRKDYVVSINQCRDCHKFFLVDLPFVTSNENHTAYENYWRCKYCRKKRLEIYQKKKALLNLI